MIMEHKEVLSPPTVPTPETGQGKMPVPSVKQETKPVDPEVSKGLKELKEQSEAFNKAVKKLTSKNQRKSFKFQDKINHFTANLTKDVSRHIETYDPSTTNKSLIEYVNEFYERRVEELIEEAVSEESQKSEKRAIKVTGAIARSIANAAKDKPLEARDKFIEETIEKVTAGDAELPERTIEKAASTLSKNEELGRNDKQFLEEMVAQAAHSDQSVNRLIKAISTEELEIPRVALLALIVDILGETSDSKDKVSRVLELLNVSDEEKEALLSVQEEEDSDVKETPKSGEAKAYKKTMLRTEDKDARITELLEKIGVPNPLTASNGEIGKYVEGRIQQMVDTVEEYDSISIRSREGEVRNYLDSIIYASPAGSIIDLADVDRAFELYKLVPPEDANEATLRNLQEARYIKETYRELIIERNRQNVPQKKAEYQGIHLAVKKINERRGEEEQVEFIDILETRDIVKDPFEVVTSMSTQCQDLFENLTEEELDIVSEERTNAVINHLLGKITNGESEEFTNNLQKLLYTKEGKIDYTKVALREEPGISCLVFSSESVLAYIAHLDGVQLVTNEEGVLETSYSPELARAKTDGSQSIRGLAHKEENLIMTHDSKEEHLTRKHEAGHKLAEDARKMRRTAVDRMVAFKMADAFMKHTQPDTYLQNQNTHKDQITDETRTLSKVIARVLKEGNVENVLNLIQEGGLTELGVDTLEMTEELKAKAIQILEVMRYAYTSNDRKSEEDDFQANLLNEVRQLRSLDAFSEVPEQQLVYMLGKYKDLAAYRDKKIRFLESTDYVAASQRVEELSTQMQDHFSQEEPLTLASAGYKVGEYQSTIEDPDEIYFGEGEIRDEYNENSIESLTRIRLLNRLRADNQEVPEEIMEALVETWKNRISKSDPFSTENTLKFIFDLVTADSSFDLTLPDGSNSLQENEDLLDLAEDGSELLRYYDNGKKREYLKLKSYAIKALRLRAKEYDWPENELEEQIENINETIDRVFSIYASVLAQGFEPTEEEIGEERVMTTDKYKLSEPVDIRSQVTLLDQQGYLTNYFSREEAPIIGSVPIIGYPASRMLSKLGFTPKDFAELGFVTDARQIKRNRMMPWGIGERKWGSRLAESIGFHNQSDREWRESLGADTVTRLEMKSIYEVMYDQTTKAMVHEAQIQNYHAMLLASERIGLLYFDGEMNQPGVYSAMEEVDKYYDANLYQQGQPGGALYKKMIASGYSAEEIAFIVESFNPVQKMNGVDESKDTLKFRLGTVTDHWVKRAKMMRMKDVYTTILKRGSNEDFIKQGETFSAIGSSIMKLQVKLAKEGEVYSIRNVIDAIIAVESDKPGGSLNEWKEKRKTVNIGGTNYALEDVKDFVQYFIHARTYEATATGVFGQKEVIKIGNNLYEIVPGVISIDDDLKQQQLNYIKAKSMGTDPQTQEERRRMAAAIDMQLEPLKKNLEDLRKAYNSDKTSEIDKARLGADIIQREGDIQKMLAQKDQLSANNNPEEIARQFSDYFKLLRVQDSNSIPQTVRDLLDKNPNLASHIYRDFNASINMKNPQGYGTKTLKPFQGISRQSQKDMFGEFVKHDKEEGGENNYSLKDYTGKMMNAVEDVVVERTKALELYFAHQLLLRQAENYKKRASMLKEQWVGIARTDQLLRWLFTAGVLASIVISVGSFTVPGLNLITGLFLNPTVIALLLADYFFISNRLTQNAILWGDRKKNAVKAELELFNQEAQFEQALSNPAFSSTRARLRLASTVKGAEEALKAALVSKKDIDMPKNILQETISGAAEWVKDVVS